MLRNMDLGIQTRRLTGHCSPFTDQRVNTHFPNLESRVSPNMDPNRHPLTSLGVFTAIQITGSWYESTESDSLWVGPGMCIYNDDDDHHHHNLGSCSTSSAPSPLIHINILNPHSNL